MDKEEARLEAEFQQLADLLDVLRASSTAAPRMAAWMKPLVHALPKPGGVAVEQPMYQPTVDDEFCPVTGRTLRPWPLHAYLSELTRYHIDLVGNELLRKRLAAHGWDSPPCPSCGGPSEYLGDSMSIEAAKTRKTVTGGIRLVLCPNGLFSPATFGQSCCCTAGCVRHSKPFDHVEVRQPVAALRRRCSGVAAVCGVGAR